MTSVVLEPSCFSSMVASAVEVYSKETTGLLIGRMGKRFIGGSRVESLVLEAAYPLQTAKRGFTSVMVGSAKAFRRAKTTLSNLGFELVGEYHSHPGGYARLTLDDEDYIREQLTDMAKEEEKVKERNWLELIIGIRMIVYKWKEKPGWYPVKRISRVRTKKIEGILRTTPKIGYHISIIGYWVDMEAITPTEIYYSRY